MPNNSNASIGASGLPVSFDLDRSTRPDRRIDMPNDRLRAWARADYDPDGGNDTHTTGPVALMSAAGLRKFRALTSMSGPDGGYTVAPTDLVEAFELAMLDQSAVRQLATIHRRNRSADSLVIPYADETDSEGEIIPDDRTEIPDASEADIEFGAKNLFAYLFSSKIVKLPRELLEDSDILARELGRILGDRVGRFQNRKYTVGSGSGEPLGVLTAAPVGKTAAAADAFTADELLALVASVPGPYRRRANWMMHPDVWLEAKQMKDAEGRYTWKEAGLDQWPVAENTHMPATLTAGSKTVLFGDFSRYHIRDNSALRINRIIEAEGYIEEDAIGFIGLMSSDGTLIDAGTGPVKALRQGE